MNEISGFHDVAVLLNADPTLVLDHSALQRALHASGENWAARVATQCPHLFSGVPLFVSQRHYDQMRAVIEAVERVVQLPGWDETPPEAARGVFYGYDFHLNASGAHLIEINTNAGGGFLNALLLASQQALASPGVQTATADLSEMFAEMFRAEWRAARGEAPLETIAIVDEQPEQQYLYPEFLLAQRWLAAAGIRTIIADPSQLQARDGGLYFEALRLDLVYNRLTDFSLQQHEHLRQAWQSGGVVLTPSPAHYARYADKRQLVRLSDAEDLRQLGACEADIATLLNGVPETRQVVQVDADRWWAERKHWFFKPVSGYGSKGSYSGAKLTKRVFEEILQGGYIAQRLAPPGERIIQRMDEPPVALKCDVRCYVYAGRIQLAAARLYQGQTTNFRTSGGGFAPVRVVG
ncbi:MAG: hypothetical protein PHW66_01095 [Gallionella sp.]|jgi:hypothetical protein|nr:hypothetical protein [Gallionella sp.]